MSAAHRPTLIGSTDYRVFLKATYEYLKDSKPFFSYRWFSRKAGLRMPGLLKMVIDGTRNLTPASTEKFIVGLGLRRSEAEYFRILVRYNQAKTDAVRKRHFERLRKYMERRHANILSLGQYDYLSNWYIPVVREMIPCDGFRKEPEKIRRFLLEEISPEKIQEALNLLLRLELVRFDKKGALEQNAPHLETDDSIANLAQKNYHWELMGQAMKSIERSRPEERELQALTMSIDPAVVPQAKKRIREFMEEMRELMTSAACRQVYQLNVQLFNLTKERFPE